MLLSKVVYEPKAAEPEAKVPFLVKVSISDLNIRKELFMIKATLSNEILKYITEIDRNRYKVSEVSLPVAVASKLRKNSKKT